LQFDVGRVLRLPGFRETLSGRILDETEVFRILALEPGARNHALLKLLYAGGLRVSEICALKWSDLQVRTEGGQATVYGKGNKTRVVLLPGSVFGELLCLRENAANDVPVFRSRKGGHLDPSQALRIVKAAAKRAGVLKAVSPHWFRHAHASHALDHGAPISLVQVTLGHASVATTGRYLHARPNDSSCRYLPL
jgi:integrase/recombinase XerD